MVEHSRLNHSEDGGSNSTPPLQPRPHVTDGFRGRVEIREIEQPILESLVRKFHYSKVMPRLTELCLGGFVDDQLVIGSSFGWGRKPLETIRCCFPSLATKNYYEIGKMCGDDGAPPNTESAFIGAFLRWFKKNRPDIKVIFTWSDGVWGKPGYVYQSSNFLYGGEIWTDRYLVNGCIVNPSQLRSQLIPVRGESLAKATQEQRRAFEAWKPPSLEAWRAGGKNPTDRARTLRSIEKLGWENYLFSAKWLRSRPSHAEMGAWGWRHITAQQFRYVYLLSDKDVLLKESKVVWTQKYPKGKDLRWKEGKTVLYEKPEFRSLSGITEE